jgi:hypothetical protein
MSRLPFAAILTAIACAATLCAAVCPSNGDTRVLYVTANGDRGFHDILMLDTSGRPVGTAINWTSVPKEVVLLKLRGMAFGPDGRMYLASAMGSHSKIVVFSKDVASDCTRQFEEVLTALGPDQRRLKHPYSLVVVPGWLMKPSKGDEGTKKHPRFVLMVSNQNSVSVTWMNGLDGTPLPAPDHTLHRHTGQASFSTPHEKGKPAPSGADAEKNSTLPPAEPVPDDGAGAKAEAVTRSERADLNGVFTIAGSAEEQAMANVEDQYRLLSVRGAALAPDDRWLVLADVDGDALRVFDVRNGKYSWSIPVPAPIQVAFAPAGFLNLDGRHPAADLVPHALITTKTQNIYVVPIVDLLTHRAVQAARRSAAARLHTRFRLDECHRLRCGGRRRVRRRPRSPSDVSHPVRRREPRAVRSAPEGPAGARAAGAAGRPRGSTAMPRAGSLRAEILRALRCRVHVDVRHHHRCGGAMHRAGSSAQAGPGEDPSAAFQEGLEAKALP